MWNTVLSALGLTGEKASTKSMATSERQKALQLATAVLLVEVSRADFEVDPQEQQAIVNALQKRFKLSEANAQGLVKLGEQAADDAVSLYGFTKQLKQALSEAEKTRILSDLWRVVFADGVLDKHEEYLVRRIADLLSIPHQVFIETRNAVRKEVTPQGD